ncbi:MAG: hypothetical protein CR978_02210 [Gammaproteobacteria bacterium]|nr:MAG: hypothetical protein CR978_02210 [Gammaproteobacteria bacterium]
MNFRGASSRGVRIGALGLMLLCVGCVWVKQAIAAEVVLTARPGVCLLDTIDDKPCVMSVLLEWHALDAGDYCLYTSVNEGEPLRCWQQSKRGAARHHLSAKEHVQYWLTRGEHSRRLAPITVRIVGVNQRNPKRRRRRHPWSIF